MHVCFFFFFFEPLMHVCFSTLFCYTQKVTVKRQSLLFKLLDYPLNLNKKKKYIIGQMVGSSDSTSDTNHVKITLINTTTERQETNTENIIERGQWKLFPLYIYLTLNFGE